MLVIEGESGLRLRSFDGPEYSEQAASSCCSFSIHCSLWNRPSLLWWTNIRKAGVISLGILDQEKPHRTDHFYFLPLLSWLRLPNLCAVRGPHPWSFLLLFSVSQINNLPWDYSQKSRASHLSYIRYLTINLLLPKLQLHNCLPYTFLFTGYRWA